MNEADKEKELNSESGNSGEDTTGNNKQSVEEPGITETALDTDIEKLQKQLDESEKLVNSYKDQLLRLAAEFENFKKRVEQDKIEFIKYANERIIKELLPILDDFSRALTNGKATPEFEPFYRGVDLIYQKLLKLLESKGVKPIESVGKEFDVTYHDVLMQVPRPDLKPHTIIEEVERGYMLHDKVIKHAKVIVAGEPKEEDNDQK
ncbi:MAG: nucleotide exchange factor GrpE [Candidatus Kryptoniota bacterium]